MPSGALGLILDGCQGLFFLALVFLAALFLGAETFSGVFLVRFFTLAASFFWFLKCCFFGSSLLEPGKKYLRKCLVFFFLFLMYSCIQWLGKDLVHTKILPGTLAPFRTIDLTIQLIFYFLFFMVALDFFISKKKFEIFTWILWVQLGLLVAIGFWQGFGPYKVSEEMFRFIEMPPSLSNFYSTFTNPNHIGAYFSIAGAFLIISIIYSIESLKRNERDGRELLKSLVYFLLLPAMILSEIYAQARTGFFLQLIFIFIFTLITVPSKHRLTAFVAMAFLGISYLFLMKSSPIVFPLEPFFKDIHKGLNYRFAVAGDAIHIFFNYPIFGTGFGSCKFVTSVYQRLEPEEFKWYTVINHHLELLFSSGIIGYLLFIVPIVAVVWHYGKRARESDSYLNRVYGLGAFIAIALTGTLGSYIDDYLSVPSITLLFLAHLAVLVNAGSGTFAAPPESLTRPKMAPLVFLAGLSILTTLGLYMFNTYTAQRYMIQSDGSSDACAMLEKSVAMRPDYPEAWVRLGLAYESKASLEFRAGYDSNASITRAIEAHGQATKLTPLWPEAWTHLGRAQVSGGKYAKALVSLRRAIELAPYDRDRHLFVLATQLRIAGLAKDPQLQVKALEGARWVVMKTKSFPRPIISGDHSYLGSKNQNEVKLHDQDQIRIASFLETMGIDQ